MKLRIRDNSIRLRLSQTEVETVRADALVRGRVRFAGGNTFDYILESSPATVKPEAHISNNALTVRIPESEILQWSTTEQVSISAEQILDGGAGSVDVQPDGAVARAGVDCDSIGISTAACR